MKRCLFLTMLLPLAATLCACHSSADVVATSFEEMIEITKAYPNDCEAMGNALDHYINENIDRLATTLNDKGNATSEESKRIFNASYALHEQTKTCQNDSMESFRKKLAELTLSTAEDK